MLVFTRRPGEGLMIRDFIVVKVLGRDGEHVRLGIEAPRNIPVMLGEKYEKARAEKETASVMPVPTARTLHLPKRTNK